MPDNAFLHKSGTKKESRGTLLCTLFQCEGINSTLPTVCQPLWVNFSIELVNGCLTSSRHVLVCTLVLLGGHLLLTTKIFRKGGG